MKRFLKGKWSFIKKRMWASRLSKGHSLFLSVWLTDPGQLPSAPDTFKPACWDLPPNKYSSILVKSAAMASLPLLSCPTWHQASAGFSSHIKRLRQPLLSVEKGWRCKLENILHGSFFPSGTTCMVFSWRFQHPSDQPEAWGDAGAQRSH